MKIACVLITHFRAKAEMRRHAELRDRPAVIVDRRKAKPLVVGSFPGASRVTVGMTLEQAISQHADTILLDSDEPYYYRIFQQILKSLQGVSDRVEGEELGIVYVRFDGLEGMYGGEARLVSALLNIIPPYMNPRIGVGEGKFPAYVAARLSSEGCARRVPEDVASFLAELPVSWLPATSEAKALLHNFSLITMAQVKAIGIENLIAQFGNEGKRIYELCNGIDTSPLVPLEHRDSVVEYMALPFYSTSQQVLQVAVDALLKRAFDRPDVKGRYALNATLECSVFGEHAWNKAIGFKQGVNTWDKASFIIGSQLEVDFPQAPIDDVTLTLSDFTGDSGLQMGLIADMKENRQRQLAEINQHLESRMKGNHVLHKVVEVAPWHPVPEMRALQVPIDSTDREAIKSLYVPVPISVRENDAQRPIAFSTGKRWRKVNRIEDLWMFDLWWLPEPIERTYYRVTQDDGRQLTLFQDKREKSWYQQSY